MSLGADISLFTTVPSSSQRLSGIYSTILIENQYKWEIGGILTMPSKKTHQYLCHKDGLGLKPTQAQMVATQGKTLSMMFIPRPTTVFCHESLGNIRFRYPFLFHSLLLKLPWKRGHRSSRSLHRGVGICLVIVSTQLLTSTGRIVYSSACKTAMEMDRHY
jgi:hypothetical protein